MRVLGALFYFDVGFLCLFRCLCTVYVRFVLDFIWCLFGFYLVSFGFHLGFIWVLCGFYAVSVWLLFLGLIWVRFGFYLGFILGSSLFLCGLV